MAAKLSGLPGRAASHCTLPPGLVIRIVTGLFEQTGEGERVGAESTPGVGNTLSVLDSETALQPFAPVTVTAYRLPLSASRVNLPVAGNDNVGVLSSKSTFLNCRGPLGKGSGREASFVHL